MTLSVRDHLHELYCLDTQCAAKGASAGPQCLKLDSLITMVEIEALEQQERADARQFFPLNTVDRVRGFAHQAHIGQVDKIGAPYFSHVSAVANGVVAFGEELVMAGYLHDVLEDTAWTASDLVRLGIPPKVLKIVQLVTSVKGEPYMARIKKILDSYDATLIKIADNAHNSHPDRLAWVDPKTRERLERKYATARRLLWPPMPSWVVRRIVESVNPALLVELEGR